MKLCKDCKHYGPRMKTCARETYTSPIDGEEEPKHCAVVQRMVPAIIAPLIGACGKNGRFWVEKIDEEQAYREMVDREESEKMKERLREERGDFVTGVLWPEETRNALEEQAFNKQRTQDEKARTERFKIWASGDEVRARSNVAEGREIHRIDHRGSLLNKKDED